MYLSAAEEGAKRANNAQLLPRLELMQKVLELWPTE
jgi:hypothetical protein